MLTSQRQYFADLDVFILDLLCILLLSTDCSLNAIKKSCIIHPHSKATFLKLSKLKELQFRLLEFFCYLRTWSTQKPNALSRQRLLVIGVLSYCSQQNRKSWLWYLFKVSCLFHWKSSCRFWNTGVGVESFFR